MYSVLFVSISSQKKNPAVHTVTKRMGIFNDEGEVIDVVGELNHDAQVYLSCVHEYVAGKITRHIKNSDNKVRWNIMKRRGAVNVGT